ncbi:MAG: hypothetical protein KAI24_18190, partial [Planctomycetes bacterium]|nr:hypothetical protein [Planctomycetota bacterium]
MTLSAAFTAVVRFVAAAMLMTAGALKFATEHDPVSWVPVGAYYSAAFVEVVCGVGLLVARNRLLAL